MQNTTSCQSAFSLVMKIRLRNQRMHVNPLIEAKWPWQGSQTQEWPWQVESQQEKSNGRDNNVNGVQRRGNSWMWYCKCKKCACNNNYTSGFHAEWKNYPIALCLIVDHDYWKFSYTAPNNGNTGSSSGVWVTQGSGMSSQHTSAIYELVQRHQGESSDSNFTSFLSNLS